MPLGGELVMQPPQSAVTVHAGADRKRSWLAVLVVKVQVKAISSSAVPSPSRWGRTRLSVAVCRGWLMLEKGERIASPLASWSPLVRITA